MLVPLAATATAYGVPIHAVRPLAYEVLSQCTGIPKQELEVIYHLPSTTSLWRAAQALSPLILEAQQAVFAGTPAALFSISHDGGKCGMGAHAVWVCTRNHSHMAWGAQQSTSCPPLRSNFQAQASASSSWLLNAQTAALASSSCTSSWLRPCSGSYLGRWQPAN